MFTLLKGGGRTVHSLVVFFVSVILKSQNFQEKTDTKKLICFNANISLQLN